MQTHVSLWISKWGDSVLERLKHLPHWRQENCLLPLPPPPFPLDEVPLMSRKNVKYWKNDIY
jgi:hypothetical protein